jgi:hypothetical protein
MGWASEWRVTNERGRGRGVSLRGVAGASPCSSSLPLLAFSLPTPASPRRRFDRIFPLALWFWETRLRLPRLFDVRAWFGGPEGGVFDVDGEEVAARGFVDPSSPCGKAERAGLAGGELVGLLARLLTGERDEGVSKPPVWLGLA